MLLDNLRIAVHHLLCNKKRTIYTIFISLILSFLSIFLLVINISVRVNGDKLSENVYFNQVSDRIDNTTNEYIDLNFGVFSESSSSYNYILKDDVFQVISSINNSVFVDRYSIDLRFKEGRFDIENEKDESNNKIYYSSIQCVDINKCVIDGKMTLKNNSSNDKNGKYLYVSENYAKENNINVGDKLIIKSFKSDTKIEFEVLDIYSSEISKYFMLLDTSFLNDDQYFGIYGIDIKLNKNNDVKETIKYNGKLIDEYKSLNKEYYYHCINYSIYQKVQIYTNIFFYVTLIFIVIVIILSISIINNSILVLLDLNKDRIGLLRALGIKNKNLLFIIGFEIFITVLLGYFLSIIIFYSLTYFVSFINDRIFNTLYSFLGQNTLLNFDIILYNKFYILIILMFIILLSMMIISFKTIKKIMNNNPSKLLRRDE